MFFLEQLDLLLVLAFFLDEQLLVLLTIALCFLAFDLIDFLFKLLR